MKLALALTRRLPLTGVGGLATLAIAWSLAPLSVALQFVTDNGTLFVINFTAVLALATYAVARHSGDERERPGASLGLAPWTVMAATAAGYWTSSATGNPSGAVIGALIATALALAAAPPIYRSATPSR